MIDIYYKQQNYHNDYHYHCLKNYIKQMLEYYTVPDAYLFLDMTTSFTVHIDQRNGLFIDNDLPRRGLRTDINMPFKTERFTDYNEAENKLSEKIKNNIPVIVSVDTFYLPYQISYNKNHGAHAIIVCDIVDSEYSIVDWYEPHFFKGNIQKDILNKARGSENEMDTNPFSGERINYSSWYFSEYPNKAKYYNNTYKFFCEGLRNIYTDFYLERKSFVIGNKYYGICAFEILIKYLNENVDWEQKDKHFYYYIHKEIFLLYISKKLIRYYVTSFSNNFNVKGFEKFKEFITELLAVYENTLFLIMKNSVINRKDMTGKILNKLGEILYLENELGNELYRIINLKGYNNESIR